ncbi:hypothetical protein Kpho01_01360 [Kitasatospora phosalacinea]|uniref:Uncharacterized protein n=1 Tax=Kitasatospora phosalacinea TaxID=2065 RepID=A0A9W6UM35_9ACTN|nr:hypothetical protein Kpho01_01360 [Kitasatospora phosalacinea]
MARSPAPAPRAAGARRTVGALAAAALASAALPTAQLVLDPRLDPAPWIWQCGPGTPSSAPTCSRTPTGF